MHRRRAVLAVLTASTTITNALPPDLLSIRASSSCPKDLLTCSSSLPPDFCCPADTNCHALAGDTSALCCPSGSDCDRIRPISCDVRMQDPSEYPTAVIFTSVFDVNLPSCANGCCPFGYACDDGQCVRDDDQSKKPTATSTTTSSAAATSTTTASTTRPASSSTSTGEAAASHTLTASATATADAGAGEGGGMKSKTMSIIGGAVGGALVLIGAVIGIILCMRCRKKRTSTNPDNRPPSSRGGEMSAAPLSRSGSSSIRARGLLISEPISQQEPFRTDFILKSPSAASSISQQPINSRWSGGFGDGGGGFGGGGAAVAAPRNLTPPRLELKPETQYRLSIPNPFASPDPSDHHRRAPSPASCYDDNEDDDRYAKTGEVGRLAPIRNLRASRRIVSRHTEPQDMYDYYDEKDEADARGDNVFADEYAAVAPPRQQQQQQQQRPNKDRMTTFSDMMERAELGGVHRGERYVPVPGTTPRI